MIAVRGFAAWAAMAAFALGAPGAAPASGQSVQARGAAVETPADLYGDLFVQVQMRRIFADGKTFVDAVPRESPATIMAAYARTDTRSDAALRSFVAAHFTLPPSDPAPSPALVGGGPRLAIGAHIAALWPHLTRESVTPPAHSSALALPERFVVPGGRFREMYYWDSYFTMLGLKADGRDDLVEAMLADFVSLVERYGHVPNGTRSYYVSRSQPPFLYLMMGLSRASDPALLRRRLAALRAEHAYWMSGGHRVTMPDGSRLNRYWGGRDTPRDESWREDVETARASVRPAPGVYRDLRAAAESGWDFSTRWFADGKTLASIDTTNIVPVDLNSLLYGLESTIAARCKALADRGCQEHYALVAARRRSAMLRYLYSRGERRFGDWDLKQRRIRAGITAATLYPLFTGVVGPGRTADAVARSVEQSLLATGGLRTTTRTSGQQWDAPNGWAPLQWIAAEGLRTTGNAALGERIARRFQMTVLRTYRGTGKLVEKYDVEQSVPGGGGEYPTQDGFGWTNGVMRAMMDGYPLD